MFKSMNCYIHVIIFYIQYLNIETENIDILWMQWNLHKSHFMFSPNIFKKKEKRKKKIRWPKWVCIRNFSPNSWNYEQIKSYVKRSWFVVSISDIFTNLTFLIWVPVYCQHTSKIDAKVVKIKTSFNVLYNNLMVARWLRYEDVNLSVMLLNDIVSINRLAPILKIICQCDVKIWCYQQKQ